ncbi:uncharacterized protein RAG0_12602 [Rhynchosporium agropyri]|uniref:Uncharacterized protein n=1 Tax=Rhynchosporium agropyri TaxID=914238 RepID=A0A1E1L922_9HELO|nr:uncharacterized protein RAG0_12602 [Rhynchosporium agropyri]
MENSTDDRTWCDSSNATSSMDIQTIPSDLDFWSQILFSEPGSLAQDSQGFSNSSIDSIIMTPQHFQNNGPSNHDLQYHLDTKMLSPNELAAQSYNLPSEESSQDIKKVVNEIQEAELVTVKGQVQTANSELYTIKSNHTQLLRWTLDMGETVKALLKWLAENTGAHIVGQEGNRLEDLGSWLDPASES